jgi:translation initiation factor IF-2
LHELTADPKAKPLGTVIESHVDPGVGPLATLLVKEGTLKPGDIIVIGSTWGKIRFIEDWNGRRIQAALPAMPVRIAGLKSVPAFGDNFTIAQDEKEAKTILETQSTPKVVRSVSDASMSNQEFRVIVRADVVGSLEAVKASLYDIPQEKVKIKILAEGVGTITESDVNLAVTAGARIFGFRAEVPKNVADLAKRQQVEIKIYDTIYKLTDELYSSIENQLTPEIVEATLGQMTVLKIFFNEGETFICGGKVISGHLEPYVKIRILRDGTQVGDGKITGLKIGPTSVDRVDKGSEGGAQVYSTIDKIKEGDILEAYSITKKVTKLT